MNSIEKCRLLSDDELVSTVERLAAEDKTLTRAMLVHLAVMDERPICRKKGFASLYVYCTNRLRFSESIAYSRIFVARLVPRFPIILDMIENGELTLSTLMAIGQHLNKDNAGIVLERVKRKNKREVELIAASLDPGPARRDVMVRQPMPTGTADWPASKLGQSQTTAAPTSFSFDKIEAVDGERRRLHFDVGPETARLLERAREVLRHKFPLASFEDIVREALKMLLDERDPEIKLNLEKENAKELLTNARRVPVWVRRKVWRRDGGRCAYLAEDGTRCQERGGLEYDHAIPFARGGRSDDPANIRLLCRAHNQLAGQLAFPPNGASRASA